MRLLMVLLIAGVVLSIVEKLIIVLAVLAVMLLFVALVVKPLETVGFFSLSAVSYLLQNHTGPFLVAATVVCIVSLLLRSIQSGRGLDRIHGQQVTVPIELDDSDGPG